MLYGAESLKKFVYFCQIDLPRKSESKDNQSWYRAQLEYERRNEGGNIKNYRKPHGDLTDQSL